ncbi:MAG TPA: DNA-binding protein [Burkholderiaceae bacterium]
MPRGIQEQDVWQAADALLLEGARPTIERVRQKIGSGSPNTVSPFLETWFKHLGGRIKDPGAFAAPPGVPDPVLQAARHFWEAALAQTRLDFDERLREGMAAAVANVEAEKERAALAEAAAFEAAGKATRLQTELAEVQARLEQEKLAHAATQARLAAASDRVDELKARVAELDATLTQVRNAAQHDVATALERFAAAERRAALEIDAERGARAKAEKRAEALERKLETVAAEAQAAQAQHADSVAQLRSERGQLAGELARARDALEAASGRLAALASELTEARRDAHAAKGQAELAERVVMALKPHPARTASRSRATKVSE